MSEIPKKSGYRSPRIPIDQIAEVVEDDNKIIGILIPEEPS